MNKTSDNGVGAPIHRFSNENEQEI